MGPLNVFLFMNYKLLLALICLDRLDGGLSSMSDFPDSDEFLELSKLEPVSKRSTLNDFIVLPNI